MTRVEREAEECDDCRDDCLRRYASTEDVMDGMLSWTGELVEHAE